ncbi:hypothetical protein SCA6_002635, partial [Theobroma cacao]
MVIGFVITVRYESLLVFSVSTKKEISGEKLMFNTREAHPKFLWDDTVEDNINEDKLLQLPLFKIEELAIATNNFNLSNKLEQRGFAAVYRAWQLWNEDNILALPDKVVSDPCHRQEILRCIHMGLLCVEESTKDSRLYL